MPGPQLAPHAPEEVEEKFKLLQRTILGIAEPVLKDVIKVAAGLARTTGDGIARIATALGAAEFAKEWKWARLAIPLQTRLAAEQGLWDLGGDYRRLISGFGPIKDEEEKRDERELRVESIKRLQRRYRARRKGRVDPFG